MGRLVLPHALLPAVKGLRSRCRLRETPRPGGGEAALPEDRGPSLLPLIDTFRRAASNPPPPPPPPSCCWKGPRNKASVSAITICAYKSILALLLPLAVPPRNYCVFIAFAGLNAVYTEGESGGDALLKNPGDVLIASPLHRGWKIRGCET